jgi:uncharacterized protein (DUF983 family)
MLKKGSKLYSIINFKCPRCNEGRIFETTTFSFRKPFDMNESCPSCGLNYTPEPGFYYGSMFLSYIWTAWLFLCFGFLFRWVLKFSLINTMILLVTIAGILFVWIFRISRVMYLSFHVKYQGK